MSNTTPRANLTEMERYLLDCVTEGMDAPGCGYLFHITDDRYTPHQYAGIIGSLVKKGLIVSSETEADGDVFLDLAEPHLPAEQPDAPLGIGTPGHTCTRYNLEGVEARLAEINEWINGQPISGHAARFNWNASQFGIVVIMDGLEACFITN